MDKSIYPCSPPIYKKISNIILFQTSVQKVTHQYIQYKYCLQKSLFYIIILAVTIKREDYGNGDKMSNLIHKTNGGFIKKRGKEVKCQQCGY